MIVTRSQTRANFAIRLARRAQALAQARAETALRTRRGGGGRWRDPRLLWPLFSRDI